MVCGLPYYPLRWYLFIIQHKNIHLDKKSSNMTTERKLILANGKQLDSKSKCFVIAEIGQNHQGDIDTAKTLIKIAKVNTQLKNN